MKGCKVCLVLKVVRHKSCGNLQFPLVIIHQYNDLSMNFVTSLPILTNFKDESYDFILIIIDKLTKLIYYKQVEAIIDTSELVKVMINVVVWHHSLSNSIVIN